MTLVVFWDDKHVAEIAVSTKYLDAAEIMKNPNVPFPEFASSAINYPKPQEPIKTTTQQIKSTDTPLVSETTGTIPALKDAVTAEVLADSEEACPLENAHK